MLVNLHAPSWATHLLSDRDDWTRNPIPVDEIKPFHLPDDVYFEYAYQDQDGHRRPDPNNPNPILNPWWDFASNLLGPQYSHHPLARISGVAPRGQVIRLTLQSQILNEERRLLIYSPPGMANAALPHILFQDGKAYYGWGKVPQVLDNLMAAGKVGPAHLIFVPPRKRTAEYAFNSAYRKFLMDELLPLVEKRVPCDGRRAAWGASLGGLLSAQLAWQYPEKFQKVIAQSGAFLFSEDMDLKNPFAGGESFLHLVATDSPRDLSWYLECGKLEWLWDSNQRLAAALKDNTMAVQFQGRNAGHNWINWRNGLADALIFTLSDWL